ncbi:MAG TPA: putative Ig domain-containing protein, partial [Clostridia bacterium]|nr:putative Ig domain-containing protein [Clostridia bacterium]
MRIHWSVPLVACGLLMCGSARGGMVLPLEIHQESTLYNYQSQLGVPISAVANVPPGSDGRMPTGMNESGSFNPPTPNQFSSLVSFGAVSGLGQADWQTVSNSVMLREGGTLFSPTVAQEMKLPLATSNNTVVMVLRRAQIGAPFLSRQVSFAFGSLVQVPDTDEQGKLQTNMIREAYWLPEPYSTNNHQNAGYYWSPHARQVFAIQAGPMMVTWRKASPYTSATVPTDYVNANGPVSFETNGGTIYLLYSVRYVASGSAVKPPRKMYWTEHEFRNLGKPVVVPAARVGGVNIVYNNNFPRTVPTEYVGPGHTKPTEGTTNQIMPELRSLWYDQSLGTICAYNAEGRVFVELLGDARPDGQTREHLGFEIVDVFRQPSPSDVRIELGELITPPPPGSLQDLYPEPVLQSSGASFTFQHNIPGSDKVEYYATRETHNLNDYVVHWMEESLVGLKWPSLFGRYRLVWPADASKYSHYVRPLAATEDQAKLTAIALPTQNAPTIEYQDPLDRPRAKLTEEFKFYTWLDTAHPAHRTLLRFSAGEDYIAFERVLSWLDANLKSTNFANSVAEQLSGWNQTNGTFAWPDEMTAPRVVNETVQVGSRITAPAGEAGAGSTNYLAGYINTNAGNLFNPNAYVDPIAKGFALANQGAIIPVNAIPGKNTLEVWWFRTNNPNAGPNAGNTARGFATLYWPSALGRYTICWPESAPEIVLASKLGSGTLNTFQTQGSIYYQNDPARPGYNPNEEHALMSGGIAYATRDDLNLTNLTNYSSAPFVLIDYVAQDGRPAITPFKVLREKPEMGYVFDYLVPAGQLIEPPPPLAFLAKPVDGSGPSAINYNHEPSHTNGDLPGAWLDSRDLNGPYTHYRQFTYRDRKENFWVYRGLHAGLPQLQWGTYAASTGTFGPPVDATAIVGEQFTYHIHASRQDEYLTLTAPEGLPSWLTIHGLSLQGKPDSSAVGKSTFNLVVEDNYEHTRVTNFLTLQVNASGTTVAQGPLQISCTNAYSGTITIYSNRAPFLALSPTPSNSFTMRYYYRTEPSFAWPGIANPPAPGTIVPYLRPYHSASNTFAGDGASKTTAALDIVYRPFWPERDPKDSTKPLPVMPFGYTLTEANPYHLPQVRGMKTAQILYQQSTASDLTKASPTVILHDPTREKYCPLDSQGLEKLPEGVRTDYYQGKYFFPNLPPHLALRLFFDPNRGAKGSIVLKGEFKAETLGESYLLLNLLRGPDLAAVKALCPVTDRDYSKWSAAVDSLATKVETFYENPSKPGTYIPNPALTASVGINNLASVADDDTAVDSYALSATGPGSGFVTLLESSGTAFTQPSDPVAMHVFRVGDSLYVGETKIIASANPLSEQVTFQHTADLAGHSDEFEYEWKIAAPVDGVPPVADTAMSRYLSLANGLDVPRYTLGGAGIQALCDNYVVMRYRSTNPSANPVFTNWSGWTSPKLAEGWIKRVLAGINPFNQRVTDLFNNRVNTDVSILTQAGHRWEGDIALNADTMDKYGLIEIYETVLRRGRMLSIESGINYGPANDALLLAAGYLNDLYLMEGNEAWADAADPTIGIGTKDQTYGDIATALFAFKGQVPSLLEEELALVRGRDDFALPGVQVAPLYNRLAWNYTRGIDAGEVIYALNYNIQEDPNSSPDGIIDAADAAKMFPQGHGDAYGHYLTALKGYYSLIINSYFDWVPRAEAVNVLGQPVQVDYLDERKFAAAAAALARAGRQAFDLTWRKDYQPVHQSGWDHMASTRVNTQRNVTTTRYWGLDHWASRTGHGAYLNWVIGNAILPDVDPNPTHEGIRKIDRTTIPELQELVSLEAGLQTAMDNAEAGLSPLGVPEGGLAFDINPSTVVGTDNGTHFEQIFQRAKVALNNAVASFDDAKGVTSLMRSQQDSLVGFQATVARQEQAYNDALIEIYGSPYPEDMGPGKTYPQGYEGPDLIHFAYVDRAELNFPGLLEPAKSVTFKIDIQDYTQSYNAGDKSRFDFVVQALRNNPEYKENGNYISFTLDSHGFFQKPADWTSTRTAPGKVQDAISGIILARNAALRALTEDIDAKYQLDRRIELFNARVAVYESQHDWNVAKADIQTAVESVMFAAKMFKLAKDTFSDGVEQSAKATLEAIPKSLIVGLANGGDTLSGARGAILAAAAANKTANSALNFAKEFAVGAFQTSKNGYMRIHEATVMEPLRQKMEAQNEVYEMEQLLTDLQQCLFTINQRVQELDDAQRHYRQVLAQGDRIQQERETFRKHAAAVVQGYRTRDAAFRIFRNEKLERYKTLFDLAARYSLLAANAYDYETGLLNSNEGRKFLNRILNARALGVVRNGEPQYAGSNTGDPGLSSALAEMKA